MVRHKELSKQIVSLGLIGQLSFSLNKVGVAIRVGVCLELYGFVSMIIK